MTPLMRNRGLIRGSRGQAVIELALIMPLLLFLAVFIFDFSRAIYAHNAVVNMSREGANFASRTENSPQIIINSLANTASPLSMSSYGMIYITELNGRADGQVEVVSQHKFVRSGAPPDSKVSSQVSCAPWASGDCAPASGNRPLANLTALHLNPGDIAPGQEAYAVEVFYNYQVIFSNIISYRPLLYSISTFKT